MKLNPIPQWWLMNYGLIAERLRAIVLKSDFDYSEFQAGVIAIVWGLWIGVPNYQRSIEILHEVIFPRAIAIPLFVIGVGQVWALLSHSVKWRRLCGYGAVGCWGFVATLLGLLIPAGISFPTAVCFTIAALWGLIRLRRENMGATP